SAPAVVGRRWEGCRYKTPQARRFACGLRWGCNLTRNLDETRAQDKLLRPSSQFFLSARRLLVDYARDETNAPGAGSTHWETAGNLRIEVISESFRLPCGKKYPRLY